MGDAGQTPGGSRILQQRWPLWILLLVLTRAPFFGYDFLNLDEAAHLQGGLELLGDGQLYRTFVDNKPPLIYAFYALASLPFGPSMLCVRICGALFSVLPCAWLVARLFGARQEGTFAGAAFLLLSAALFAQDMQAVNTEWLMLVPLGGASLCVLSAEDPRVPKALAGCFLAGVLVGLATLAKQPALAFLGAVALGGTTPRRWLSLLTILRALLAAAGAGLVLSATWLWFRHVGTHEDYVLWVWRYNVAHVRQPVPLAALVGRAVRLLGPLVVVYAIVGWAAFAGRLSAASARTRFLWLAFVCTLVPAFLGARFFGHYFLPAIFFLVALAAEKLFLCFQGWPRRVLAYMVGLAALFTGVNLVFYHPRAQVAGASLPIYRDTGRAARAYRCDTQGRLFVWGYAPMVYYYAGMRPASRFVVPIDTISGYLAGNDAFERGELDTRHRVRQEHRRWLIADLEIHKPDVIVDLSPSGLQHWDRFPLRSFPGLDHLVQNDYKRVAIVAGGAEIYRRRGCLR